MALTIGDNSSFKVSTNVILTSDNDALSDQVFKTNKSFTKTYSDGATDGKIDYFLAEKYTIAASGSQSIDLDNFTDPEGNTITAATKVKELLIHSDANNTADNVIRITGDFLDSVATSSGTFQLDISSENGTLYLSDPNDGLTITATTGDVVTIANQDSGVSVDVYVYIGLI